MATARADRAGGGVTIAATYWGELVVVSVLEAGAEVEPVMLNLGE